MTRPDYCIIYREKEHLIKNCPKHKLIRPKRRERYKNSGRIIVTISKIVTVNIEAKPAEKALESLFLNSLNFED